MVSAICRRSLYLVLLLSVFSLVGCKVSPGLQEALVQKNGVQSNPTVAPNQPSNNGNITLQGFGSKALEGCNVSNIYHVKNLNASGAGSLVAGLGSNRTIVFDVSGTINARLYLDGYTCMVIDGSGKDITIQAPDGDNISYDGPNTHHCVLKNIRSINSVGDGVNVVNGAHDILITNVSAYGNKDGNIDVAADSSGQSKNVTIQYSIIGPHDPSDGGTGGMLITGQNVTAHHNLYATSGSGEGERCPAIHANYSPVGAPNADVVNNLIWKFGRNNGTGSGYGSAVAYNATANLVGNYYYTAGTSADDATDIGFYDAGTTGKGYMAGNISGNAGINPNSKSNHAAYAIPTWAQVPTQEACAAAADVISKVGTQYRNDKEKTILSGITLYGCNGKPAI